MITKRSRTDGAWAGNRPAANLLIIGKGGEIDSDMLDKIAADESLKFAEITPRDGYSYIHMVTTGDDATYGANSNGDGYNEGPRRHHFPLHKEGAKDEMLVGGLKKHHASYMEHGGVYREHNNSRKTDFRTGKPFQKCGNIVAERYNDVMKRGELILEVPNKEWQDDLEKIASGGDVFFSQGSSVPYDKCSVCGNMATKRSEYCDHLKYSKHELTKEGYLVYAINEKPLFHDSSRVRTPADKIAFGLQKVASGQPMSDEEVASLTVPFDVMQKLAYGNTRNRFDLLDKLANMEKRLVLKADSVLTDHEGAFEHDESKESEMGESLCNLPPSAVLSHMSDKDMVMPPKMFIKMMTGKDANEYEGHEKIEDMMHMFFNRLKNTDSLDKILEDGSYVPVPQYNDEAEEQCKKCEGDLSLRDVPMQQRIIKISLSGKPKKDGHMKEAGVRVGNVSPELSFLMKEYGKYQIACIEKDASESRMLRVVAHNSAYTKRNS